VNKFALPVDGWRGPASESAAAEERGRA
jgi:hypothetical protein